MSFYYNVVKLEINNINLVISQTWKLNKTLLNI